jgi:beta-lactamase regulating signal transducer with metallopeptidase domain
MILELFPEDLSLWTVAWQSSLFAVIGLVGSFLLRRRPARASQVLFLAIIAAVFLPAMSILARHYELGLFAEKPIVLPSVEIEMLAEAPEIFPVPEIQPAVLEVPTDLALTDNGSETIRIPWRLIVLYAWMIAALILLGRLIIAFISGIRLLRHTQSDSCEHIKRAADSARARLGITKGLKIRSSKDVRSPMIWCWNRPPVLLVPDDLDEQFDWVDVICHELAHWRRWDHISGLIAELAVCILPWNLLLWWSKKRMVRLSEQACDDWVLAGGCAGTDYAQSLLNLSPELQMAFMPTVIGKEKPMKKRIYRIVKEKCGIPQVGVRWALVVTMIAATLTVGIALAQRRPARLEPRQRDEMIAAERQERQALEERRGDLENQARQLRARFDEVRAGLAELEASGKAESDRANEHRGELRDLERELVRVERELRGLEGQRRDREMRPRQDRAPRQEILHRLEELSRETEFLLQGLADQRFGRNDETNMLYNRLRELNEQMRQVRQQLGRQLESPGPQRREFRRDERPEGMMLEREELRERARKIELELEEIGDRNPERAERLHAELREIREAIAQIERDVSMSRERGDMRQKRLRRLRKHADELEFRFQEIGDLNPEEAQEVRMKLDQIHRQIQEIERVPGIPERPWPRDEEQIRPGAEFHRQELMVRRERLRAQLRDTELALGELNEQGKAESEQAHEHRIQLDVLQQQLREIENEFRRSEPGMAREPGREDLEREVQNLRRQMDGMNEQMGEMRELIKRLLEESKPPDVGS